MEERVLVVDTASSTVPCPLPMEGGLMPGLAKGENAGVDVTTDTGIGEPLRPIMQFHPVRW